MINTLVVNVTLAELDECYNVCLEEDPSTLGIELDTAVNVTGGSSYANDVFAFQAKVTFNIVGTSGHSREFAYVEDYVVTYSYDAGDDFYYRLVNAYLTFTDGQNQERYIFSPDVEVYMEYDSSAWVVSAEGDAVVNAEDGIVTVTGDCVINALLT